jgi:D-alanine-D-alanine ligase
MSKLRIAVLRGGPSGEYDVSLQTGGSVLKHMPEKYQAYDILISKDGRWHREGVARSPDRALLGIDAVVNALHGEYGEDGKVQQLLQSLGIPYTGSNSLASALAMNKVLSKKAFENHGIKTPYYAVIRRGDDINEKTSYIFNHFLLPFIVKPASSGSSLGVTLVKNFDNLFDAIEKALSISDTALIEDYIKGKEATCGVVDGFRGEQTYALLPVEIAHGPQHDFFNYEAKYGGGTQEICPGRFSDSEKEEIQRLAKHVHNSLGLRHYSRTDFMIHPRRGIYVLEVNTLPGMTSESLFPKSLAAVGSSLGEFLDHLISLAIG